MMKWSVEKMVDGKVVKKKDQIVPDAYQKLIEAKDDTRAAFKLSLGYGQSADFGKEKYNIQITLTCDQNSEKIEKATQLAIETIQDLNAMVQKGLFE